MPAFGRNRNAKSRQDKAFIMIILPAQLLGTQLAKTASRGVPNYIINSIPNQIFTPAN